VRFGEREGGFTSEGMEQHEGTSTALAIPGPVLTPQQKNAENMSKLDFQVTELLVSSYDPVVGKTIWQCAQCQFSSKVRYTVKQHIETHLSGFTHQCPQCEKQCKTRNALRAHVMRAHTAPSMNQQNWNNKRQTQMSPGPMSPDGFMQMEFREMGEQGPKQRRPRQARPHDEELERQIRLLLVSSYDPDEAKTTWSCAQCQYSNKLQYTVKQHIETHITNIVHQCTQCDKILKTRNALRAHMIQKHEPNPRVQSPPWMGSPNYQSPGQSPQQGQQQYQGNQQQGQRQQYQQRRPRSENVKKVPTEMDIELDRQVSELMVSNYDSVAGKTSWQCAQCHFTSKIRSTVKEHIETHISGFTHQCPYCEKTCKTRNALRVHTVRAHQKHHLQSGEQGPSNTSPPKICYEPQPQQNEVKDYHNIQQNSVKDYHNIQAQQAQPQPQVQQNSMPIAKKSVQVEQKPMYQPEPQKEQPRQGIMNHPMIGRPMYGHPMMMGHPMI